MGNDEKFVHSHGDEMEHSNIITYLLKPTSDDIRMLASIVQYYRKLEMMGPVYITGLKKSASFGKLIVARDESKSIIGFAQWSIRIRGRKEIVLQRIAVKREYINLGLGKRLLDKVLEESEKENKDVILSVVKNNERAINFYKRQGFFEDSTCFRRRKESKTSKVVISMRKKSTMEQEVMPMIEFPSKQEKIMIEKESFHSQENENMMNLMEKKRGKTRKKILELDGVPLLIDNIQKMTMQEREDVAQKLLRHYRELGFPYPHYSNDVLMRDWESLRSLDSSSLLLAEDGFVSSSHTMGTKLFKNFCPHFFDVTEGVRGVKKSSMIELFEDDEVLLRVLRNRLGITFFYRGESYPFAIDANGDMLRQGFRSMRLVPHTTNFRASVAKFLSEIHLKGEEIIYDFSMGFCQRMMGVLSSSKNFRYVGVDPWNKQHRSAKDILEFLGGDLKNRVFLHSCGSEDFCPDDLIGKIDLAMSSPPYYTKEYYADEESQAYVGRTYEEFMRYYWIPTAKNIVSLLRPGGTLCLNVCHFHEGHEMANDMLSPLHQEGLNVIQEMSMIIPKSHLSHKVGTTNLMKKEPIFILRKR